MAWQLGWAIAGEHGLYIGWQFTRGEAIAEHVNAKLGTTTRAFGGLTPRQSAEWKRCRRKGDRAIRVAIRYPA